MNEKQPIEAMDESQIPQPHGIGGWLGFFVFFHCLGLVVNVIASFVILANSYATDITLYALCYIAFETILIITFCRRYIAFRVVFLVGNIVLLAFAYFIIPDKNYALSQLVVQGIGSGLYTLYFFLSKRVANTFHNLEGVYHYKPKAGYIPKPKATPTTIPHAAPAVNELRTIHPRPFSDSSRPSPTEGGSYASPSRNGARTVPLKWVIVAGAAIAIIIAAPLSFVAIDQGQRIAVLSEAFSEARDVYSYDFKSIHSQLDAHLELLNTLSDNALTRLPAGDHSLGELREQIEQENIQAALSDPFIAEICAYDFDSAYRAWLSYYGLTSEDYYNLDYYGYFKKLWDAVNRE